MDTARLDRLLDHYLDEALLPEEKTELEQMLRASPQARLTFWQHARFHALLREAGAEGYGRALAQEPRRRWWDALAEWIALLQRHAGWALAAAAMPLAPSATLRTSCPASRRMISAISRLSCVSSTSRI